MIGRKEENRRGEERREGRERNDRMNIGEGRSEEEKRRKIDGKGKEE